MVSNHIDFKSLSKTAEVKSSSIDYRKPSFYLLVFGLLGSLVSMLVIGYAIETMYYFNKSKSRYGKWKKGMRVKEMDDELTLCEWRNAYKQELYEIVTGIYEDMQRIKDKGDSICERYKDEIEYYKYVGE